MKILAACWLITLMAAPLAAGADAPPTDASIRELLAVTESRKLLDGAAAQLDLNMQASIQQALQGQSLNQAQRRVIDAMRVQLVDLFKEELTWESLEPGIIDMHKKTFTQSEIDGMLQFYQTPAGKALIAKMPLVMQANLQLMQSRMQSLLPEVQRLQIETMKKLKAAATP